MVSIDAWWTPMATDKRQTMGTFCSYIKILHVHEKKRKLYKDLNGLNVVYCILLPC
jgi:hypothetical protein